MPNSVEYDGVNDQTIYAGVPAVINVVGAHGAILVWRILEADDTVWISGIETEDSATTPSIATGRKSTGNSYWSGGAAGNTDAGAVNDSLGWVVQGATKAAGISTPRHHVGVVGGGAPTHTDGATPLNAAISITGGTIRLGGNDDFKAERQAAAAIFTRVYSDAEFDGICTALTTKSIIDLVPVWCVDARDNFAVDYMGNLNRTSVVGTTDSSDGPTGWVLGDGATPSVNASYLTFPKQKIRESIGGRR